MRLDRLSRAPGPRSNSSRPSPGRDRPIPGWRRGIGVFRDVRRKDDDACVHDQTEAHSSDEKSRMKSERRAGRSLSTGNRRVNAGSAPAVSHRDGAWLEAPHGLQSFSENSRERAGCGPGVLLFMGNAISNRNRKRRLRMLASTQMLAELDTSHSKVNHPDESAGRLLSQ